MPIKLLMAALNLILIFLQSVSFCTWITFHISNKNWASKIVIKIVHKGKIRSHLIQPSSWIRHLWQKLTMHSELWSDLWPIELSLKGLSTRPKEPSTESFGTLNYLKSKFLLLSKLRTSCKNSWNDSRLELPEICTQLLKLRLQAWIWPPILKRWLLKLRRSEMCQGW